MTGKAAAAALAILLATGLALGAARAEEAEDCEKATEPEAKISACNAAIESGDWTGGELAWAYNNRGIAHHDLDRHEDAIRDYDKAIELDPDDERAYYNRGISYRKMGLTERAIADYNRAIEINAEYGKAFYNRGIAYELMGDFDRAIEDTERAIALDGDWRVRELQEHLKRNGFYDGEIDGIYGGGTQAALRECVRAPEC